jgi:iron complex outermembrane receptor protein
MKRIAIFTICSIAGFLAKAQQNEPAKDSFFVLTPVEVKAISANYRTPVTTTNISKSEIGAKNLGQDLPFLLNQVPSVVINSDAGNGIGYTGIHIRGTDATRINITLNGIPYNDAESQGTFFVDLPDLASSTSGIQVQRGVGTSTNGAGAFGANINVVTNEQINDPYALFSNSYGSFDSRKHTFRAGTGLINNHFTADFRLSDIHSDGFIDRAFSGLQSWYLSTAWKTKKSVIRLNMLSGKEKTYQAWYGISEEDLLAGRRTVNYAGTEKPGEPYDNETDNYKQDHYQLFWNYLLNKKITLSTAAFLTRGKGYYEQYKADQAYADYGINRNGNSDFIRQLWLDNYFYGNTFSLQYNYAGTRLTAGTVLTQYDGHHFGEVIWASNGMPDPVHRWYNLHANKTDFAVYVKGEKTFHSFYNVFADLQLRPLRYTINGFRDNPALFISQHYNFFNPKAGISYIRNNMKTYLSFGVANKEPNRDDFEAGKNQQPKPERLYDAEFGMEKNTRLFNWAVVLYYMKYRDQLVLTGMINDVGAYTRTNIPKSYRAGIEVNGSWRPSKQFSLSGNIALSSNKVIDFTEYIDDYDNGGQKINHYTKTDIAYSPAIVAGATAVYSPCSNLQISLPAKYVGRQQLDNTGVEGRSLNPFYVQDIRFNYGHHFKKAGEWGFIFSLNNVFDKQYEPNGYTYNYIAGGELVVSNYYFPMAGINFMAGLTVKF